MNKTAADVEREVEASRGNLDRTVEALREKMTPGQLFDEASRAMGGAGQQVLAKFVEQAKENPMPLAVMGLGVAWLMSTSGKNQVSAPRGYRSPDEMFSSGSGVRDKVHAAGDKVAEMVDGAREKVAGAAESARDLRRDAADQAGQYAERAQRTFAQVLEREPLLLGAAGLLVGAAIGAALPSTEIEDRMVGSLRDKVLDKGKDLAQTGLQQASDVAETAYTALKSELQASADSGASAVDRVGDAVRAGADAVRSDGAGAAN